MFIWRNFEAIWCNHHFSDKTIRITHHEFVPVALIFRQAKRMRSITLSSVASLSVPHFSTFSRKKQDIRKNVTEYIMCVLISFTTFVWNICDSKKNSTGYFLKRTYVFMQSTRCACQILMKLETSRRIFAKCSNIKFHENPSCGSRGVPREQTERQTWQN
jgi:hypothetical protein